MEQAILLLSFVLHSYKMGAMVEEGQYPDPHNIKHGYRFESCHSNMEKENYSRCNFRYCNDHVDGFCMDEEHRASCLEIARGVLCIDDTEEHDAGESDV